MISEESVEFERRDSLPADEVHHGITNDAERISTQDTIPERNKDTVPVQGRLASTEPGIERDLAKKNHHRQAMEYTTMKEKPVQAYSIRSSVSFKQTAVGHQQGGAGKLS